MRISAEELLTAVLDPESFVSWDSPPVDVGPGAKYAEDLAKARERSGVDESVVTGVGTVRGRRVAVIACEFSFLAGSIGVAAAERIVTAVEHATAEQLPLLASPTSGGTRKIVSTNKSKILGGSLDRNKFKGSYSSIKQRKRYLNAVH